MDEIIAKLKDKDAKAAYEFVKKLIAESAESDKYLELIPALTEMLTDSNSYVRTRAFGVICSQARWADKGQIEEVFEQMTPLLNDVKPTVVRQCLAALHEVALFRPEMSELICDAVKNIDLSGYKDSMSPLIKKDIEALLETINN